MQEEEKEKGPLYYLQANVIYNSMWKIYLHSLQKNFLDNFRSRGWRKGKGITPSMIDWSLEQLILTV